MLSLCININNNNVVIKKNIMKKLLFTAMALIAFSTASFASELNDVNEKKLKNFRF